MAPEALVDESLERYSSIGARLDRFYRVVFGSTHAKDIDSLGLVHVGAHLIEVQRRRNQLIHGTPGAIDDQLVEQVMSELEAEHEAWIAVVKMRRKPT